MTTSTLSFPILTPADLGFYREHGWLVTGRVLDDGCLTAAERGLHQHWSGHRDRLIPGAGKHFADWMPGGPAGTRTNAYLSLQNKLVSELAWSPMIGALAAAAACSPEIRLFADQMVYKPAGHPEPASGWRVDAHSWPNCSSGEMLSAWIPLHDCPEALSPLVVLDGSHKWSHKLHHADLNRHHPASTRIPMLALASQVEAMGYEFKPVVLELTRGQLCLYHCRTIHGRYPNYVSQPRITLSVHLQDRSNEHRSVDGRPHALHNLMCRKTLVGSPDYSDDAVFPVMWKAAAAEGGMWAL